MNKPTVQDIFLRFYPAYLEKYSPSPEQAKVSRNIINCKTGAYGANVSICEDCGTVQIHYNSCRNRCCPMCQAVPKEMWMDARREDVLDAPYFHLVFTVPDILNPVIYSNQKQLYDTLYHAASATISELAADPKHLGASVGYICILHTWGSEMNFHPHIHTILLGGGLTPKNEWKDNGTEFFLPIQVISKVFRGKYMEELKNLWETDRLEFHGTAEKYRNHYAFKELLDTCYSAEWIPYCKKTFHGAQSVIDYLGKYTHEKFVQFAEPEQLEEYLFTACGQTAVLYHAELAAALALLPEQAQEEIFRYYFLRQPQRVIGVHIGRTRSTAGRHIQLALKRLRRLMEGKRYE